MRPTERWRRTPDAAVGDPWHLHRFPRPGLHHDQGTRAAFAWRTAADKGDLDVIHDIMEDALNGWSTQKRPKPVAPEVWRGIQSLQLAGLASGYVRVSCVAASEYKMQDGRWIELRNPLQEGMAIT